MANDLSAFIGKYSLNKTLRFELRPQGRTQEWIDRKGILEKDRMLAEDYERMKGIIDDYHRCFISEVLGSPSISIDWGELDDVLTAFQKAEPSQRVSARAALEKAQGKYRKRLVDLFENPKKQGVGDFPGCASLFSADFIKAILPAYYDGDAETLEVIAKFDRFITYFTGFFDKCKLMYSSEEKAGAIAYRVVNQNFSIFHQNFKIYETLKVEHPDILRDCERELSSKFGASFTFEDVFTTGSFNRVLSQEGIEYYNSALGGIVQEDGSVVRGLNQFLSMAFQQGRLGRSPHRVRLAPLYKQILVERESLSFVLDKINDDAEATKLIEDLIDRLGLLGEDAGIMGTFAHNLRSVASYDRSAVYVSKRNLEGVSRICFDGNWSALNHALDYCADGRWGPAKGLTKAKAASWRNLSHQTVASLEEAAAIALNERSVDVIRTIGIELSTRLEKARKSSKKALKVCKRYDTAERCLLEAEEDVELIKRALDDLLACERLVRLLEAGHELERDGELYSEHDIVLEAASHIAPAYNKIRNYVTQKPYSQEKFKLNFSTETLAAGWDVNKEAVNLCTILIKDGAYYLGIIDKDDKKVFESAPPCDGGPSYQKMVYKLLPGPNKMLPKVFFSKKGLDAFQPPDYIIEGYEAGRHKLGENFDLAFCHTLIDFFKEGIGKYPGWEAFNFRFSDTESYRNIGEFYAEVARYGYSLQFTDVPAAYVDELVDQGKLYLFQIYNKDFSEKSTGKKNLHTLYFESLFSKENLEDVVFKLDGGAEVFYRPASIKDPVRHRLGEKLVNKTYEEDGTTVHIDDDLYMDIYNWANKRSRGKLSPEAEALVRSGQVVIKDVKHELVKDRRYTEPKYSFYVPITINYGLSAAPNINQDVLEYLDANPNVNIIGIDRGEKNLLYVTVINQSGDILEQRSLNVLAGVDYYRKLDKREAEREKSRRNWKSIGQIKQLKEGYLSLVVHEVARLMVKHNAILVLEDIDNAFKSSRQKIEKQVYQSFEKALIDKLGYFAQKPPADSGSSGVEVSENGGILRGYQLANRFESFQAIGRQCGFIFYVSPWNTHQIDPTTGFANLFTADYLNYSNAAAVKEFFGAFRAIRYCPEKGYFEFVFRYGDFPKLKTRDYIDEWTVCSAGERIVNAKVDGSWRSMYIDVTNELRRVFEDAGVDYEHLDDLREVICEKLDSASCRQLLLTFKTLMQMRNARIGSDRDYLLSPVRNASGAFFDSRKADPSKHPVCIDANGAYHIALKGLRMVRECSRREDGRLQLPPFEKGENERWMKWVQYRITRE